MTTDPTDLVADILINDSCGCVGGGGGTATKILAALVEAGWRAPGGVEREGICGAELPPPMEGGEAAVCVLGYGHRSEWHEMPTPLGWPTRYKAADRG